MTTISGHTTRANGTILTAAIYNADHVNHVTNAQNLNAEKLEGATPPVVDGHAVLWDGTSGAALRTAGFAPTTTLRQILTGNGLLGGGNLSADRTLSADFATQVEAEAAASLLKVMSPLRTLQFHTSLLATQAEAEAGVVNTKWMTPLRVQQKITFSLATQAEAEAGVNATQLMTPLRTSQAILALAQTLNLGAAVVNFDQTTAWDTGADDVKGAMFIITAGSASGIPRISLNGGTNYTNIGAPGAGGFGLVFVKNSIVVMLSQPLASDSIISRVVPTAGAGNIFFSSNGSGDHQGIRVM